jgi:hypothetical protein
LKNLNLLSNFQNIVNFNLPLRRVTSHHGGDAHQGKRGVHRNLASGKPTTLLVGEEGMNKERREEGSEGD